ncbi:hypothetical protein [Neisseria yangbaofengii]|uniref:hypothetical protein n=1 Tax=Neisseria yangbaofengii TaxID=2709396 RepID=UPI0013EA4536|nr:hypothetical protein [Neisseria yangbaofengii]
MRAYNEHDLSEYIANGHSFNIIGVEDLKQQHNEAEEWETTEEIEYQERQHPLQIPPRAKPSHQKTEEYREAKRKNAILADQVKTLTRQNQELKCENERLLLKVQTLDKRLKEERKKNEALLKSSRIRGRSKELKATHLKKTIELNNTQIRLEKAAANAVKAERKATQVIQETKQAITTRARKAGQAKKSPYEKAGTITAVFKLLDERGDMLQKRGGKAELTRLIIRKIERAEIAVPDTPTQETVHTWVDKWKKQKSTS